MGQDKKTITAKRARAIYADRVRATDDDGKRVRVRRPRGVSFRQWVRQTYRFSDALSPKLQAIVDGAA